MKNDPDGRELQRTVWGYVLKTKSAGGEPRLRQLRCAQRGRPGDPAGEVIGAHNGDALLVETDDPALLQQNQATVHTFARRAHHARHILLPQPEVNYHAIIRGLAEIVSEVEQLL